MTNKRYKYTALLHSNGFQLSTLKLLTTRNLRKLAIEYGHQV